MKYTLVQPPILVDSTYALNPPLGLLMLGSVLREESVDVEIVDLNLKGMQTPSLLQDENFYSIALKWILDTNPDVVGFTSMALESHVCLELARLVKQQDNAIITVFGGPHFSSIAPQMLELYPWADYVITGEAEKPLADFVHFLRDKMPFSELNNVARRTSSGIELDRQYRANTPINELPFAAHDLIDLDQYFAINKYKILCMEHARGCQLRCSFCYSEAHWGHGENIKSNDRIIAELTEMSGLGAEMIYLVADNFITNGKAAEALCAEIEQANLPLQWMCYGTLAQIRESTVKAMARAGCNSIFIGVDAVSSTNKQEFRKHYFKNWQKLESSLQLCLDHGITPTCSFMFSSADSAEGIEETFRTAIFAKNLGIKVWLNALNVYNQTHSHEMRGEKKIRYCELKPRLTYDTAPTNHVNPFAMEQPELFPMHQAAPQTEGITDLYAFCYIAFFLIVRYPITLMRYAIDLEKDASELIKELVNSNAHLFSPEHVHDSERIESRIKESFADVVRPNPAIVDVFRYEHMKQSDSKRPYQSMVNLNVGGMIRLCRLNPFKVLKLPEDLDSLRKAEKSTDVDSFPDFVVTVKNGEYYQTKLEPEISCLFGVQGPDDDGVSDYELRMDPKLFNALRYQRLLETVSLAEPYTG